MNIISLVFWNLMFYTFYMWPSSMKLDLAIERMETTLVGNNLPTSIKVLSTEIYLNFIMRHRRRLLSFREAESDISDGYICQPWSQWRWHIQVRGCKGDALASPGLLKFVHDCTILILLEPHDILRMNLLIF